MGASMQYRKLGQSDLEVSALCLGTMTWGEQNTKQEAHKQLDYAFAQGINFIDTAEMYPVPPKPDTQGLTERYIGTWLAKRSDRDKIILATKVAGRADWLPHLRGGPCLSASQIEQAINASLQRLQTDYVDLYQLHWPDRATNYFGSLGYQHTEGAEGIALEETLATLKALINEGKVRHWGLSNETPWGLMKCLQVARDLAMPAPVSVQNPYNLLNRSYEVGMAECSHREHVGLLAYSPLAFGVLTGKYLQGARPEKARLTLYERFSRYTHERAELAVQAYADLAKAHDMSLTELAMAFVTTRSFVTSNIIGATTMAQLAQNIATAELSLSPELMAELEQIHAVYTYPCP